MTEIQTGDFSAGGHSPVRTIRVIDWNIARGVHLPAILDVLSTHRPDLIVLQECDLNARRSQRRNVAEEIARKLRMAYVFGRQFQELIEGSSTSPAYIGQATLCRWPLRNPRLIRFQRQSRFWQPRWWVPRVRPFQVRLGGRMALFTEVQLPRGTLSVYNLHLESRHRDDLRASQLDEVLADAAARLPNTPVLMAGDFNFDTTAPERYRTMQRAGFSEALSLGGGPTTPRILGILPGWRVDHAFIRGPIQASAGQVLTSARGSDHYPLAFTLELL